MATDTRYFLTVYTKWLAVIITTFALSGCMRWDYGDAAEDLDTSDYGLFIINEGNFQYGNSTLSFYDPTTRSVENEVFLRANGMKLGDVAQSMTVHGGRGWIAVCNSHVVFAIDLNTMKETGRIEGLPSPRHILFVNERKAYVSQLWDNRVAIVDPLRYEVTGWIDVPGMAMETGSTEQMVKLGRYVYCTCWSYQNRLIRIDTESDRVTGELTVGIQPAGLVLDSENKLWTITTGGYEGSPYGNETPTLCRIDPATLTVQRRFNLSGGNAPGELSVNGSRDTIYWIDEDVWRMNVNDLRKPVRPFVEARGTKYYGLTVDPMRGDVYVADAIDYQQQGIIMRYNSHGEKIDEFYVGINPGAYCWK